MSKMLKIPICLTKRMADGRGGVMRWEIEVPDEYIPLATALETLKGEHFIILGPFTTVDEIRDYVGSEEYGE